MTGQTMGSRFDYVKYDRTACDTQEAFKQIADHLERMVGGIRAPEAGRAKALALTTLEEFYMWVGKAIRDDQIARNGGAELQEGRTNS
jgi:hypothetical protein